VDRGRLAARAVSAAHRRDHLAGPPPRGLNGHRAGLRAAVGIHTIKTLINRIFAKTGSRDRVTAIGYAQRHNIG
jgi:hypothetical protein